MTAPDPNHWPHLVGDPPEPPEPSGEVQYPATPMELWQQRADTHGAAHRLRSITEQAEAWKAAQHTAFLADAERALQRARVEADLTALRVGQSTEPREPAPVRDRPRHGTPERPADLGDDDQGDDDQAAAATVTEAAAALFKVAPNVSRADLQTILQTNTYWAKKLHSARPGTER